MSREVVYLMSEPPHCPYLVVSLMTLRRHYTGPVVVHAWPESFSIVEAIAKDNRLAIEVAPREPAFRGKNAQFADKVKLMQTPGVDTRVYFDADTAINESRAVDGLTFAAERNGFCATQFNHWMSNGRVIRARLERLKGKPPIENGLVDLVMNNPYPSPNGGVLAARPESPVLPVWYEWTHAAKGIFIADEAALHIMQVKFEGDFTILADGWWNASFRYWYETHKPEDVPYVWHFHGDSNARPDKSPAAVKFWMPLWQKAIDENWGNCRDWPSLACGNKYLAPLQGDQEYGWHVSDSQ